MTFYSHWRDVPAAAWRWPKYSPAEIACRGTGRLLLKEAALDTPAGAARAACKPVFNRSAYRSPEHNRAVGGASPSADRQRALMTEARASSPAPSSRDGLVGNEAITVGESSYDCGDAGSEVLFGARAAEEPIWLIDGGCLTSTARLP